MKIKKKFIGSILTLDLILKAALAGVIQALVSFFTKKKLDNWDQKRSSENEK